MNEMENYEEALHKFYYAGTIKSLPLISWDFYGPYFDTLCGYCMDIISLRQLAEKNKWSYRKEFDSALFEKNQVIVVTDTKLTIVHATDNIVAMNGYRPQEILGKNPKIFQGPETCLATKKRIKSAINRKLPFEETVVNYRKDGSTYNCWIRGEPIFDTAGEFVNFIAYEKEVA